MLHRENPIRQYHTSSSADLIQELINMNHLSVANLATKLNISETKMQSILNHQTMLTPQLANKLEQIYGISSHLLLTLDKNYEAND